MTDIERSSDGIRMPPEGDLAGSRYWEGTWTARNRQRVVDPWASGVRNHLRRSFHGFFSAVLGRGSGRQLVEVGCADSIWLPYFRRELGFSVAGIDYSATGCERARATLRDAGIEGPVYEANMFDPPPEAIERFDVVFSYGLVEHFGDTSAAVRALARLLRPNGLVITLIPNMAFVNGALQRWLNRTIYDLHVPLRLTDLSDAHRAAGLAVLAEQHLMSFNFGMLIAGSETDWPAARVAKRVVQTALIACQVPPWWLESKGIRLVPPNRWTSPYLAVVAQRL